MNLILSKIFKHLNWKWQDIRFRLGIGPDLMINHPKERILLYHGIDSVGSTEYNTRFISQSEFEKQARFFAENANCISLKSCFEENLSQNKMNLVLTFDDGYKNNLTRALPILEKYNLPATFFITAIRSTPHTVLWADFIDLATPLLPREINILSTQFRKNRKNEFVSLVGSQNIKHFLKQQKQPGIEKAIEQIQNQYNISIDSYPEDYYQTLSDEEIRQVANHPLITVGVHGLYHADLALLSEEECTKELIDCKAYLEKITGKKISAIAFPFGSFTRTVINACEKAGLEHFLAVDKIPGIAHKNLKERLGVNPFISFENQILAIIKGKY